MFLLLLSNLLFSFLSFLDSAFLSPYKAHSFRQNPVQNENYETKRSTKWWQIFSSFPPFLNSDIAQDLL